MIEALAKSVLETRYLYHQNAAQKHGLIDPPRRIELERREVIQQQPVAPQPPPPIVAPLPPGEAIPRTTWTPPAPQPTATTGWKEKLAIGLITALTGIGGAGLTYWMTRPSEPPQQNESLLDFLDREGFSAPPPGSEHE